MLAIKLKRIGKKHQPAFRLIVKEKRSRMPGDFVADLGWVNPNSHQSELDKDGIKHWLAVGAQPTATVHNLLVKNGFLAAPKIAVKMKKAAAPAGEEKSE